MIRIQGMPLQPDTFLSQYPSGPMEKEILLQLSNSNVVYTYVSLGQLNFELKLRSSIINAALELNSGHLGFEIFRESRCNPEYWIRTEEGGFMVREQARPSHAIRDIYVNSRKYGTECSTAMVIVYYGAVLAVLPETLFDQLFPMIYLMNWQHLDPVLGIQHVRNLPDYLPGDCRYFKNPDVNPETPEWQGENTIDLGNGTYYGHGIGIGTADQIIQALNKNRIPGFETSAYLMNAATRPDFNSLWEKSSQYGPQMQVSPYAWGPYMPSPYYG